MTSLIGLFMVGVIILLTFALIGNSGPTAVENIQDRFDELGCPMPIITGTWNNTGTIVYQAQSGNPTYNYPDKDNATLTLTCTPVHTIDGFDYLCGAPFGSFCGGIIYVGDVVSVGIYKIVAVFQLLTYILTPINFDLFGYTLADLSGYALIFIVSLFAVAYLFVAIYIYSLIAALIGAVLPT